MHHCQEWSSKSTPHSATGAGKINEDPYGQGWLVKVRLSDPSEADQLLSAEQYRATIKA
jgi:glycine cleavage system H lipoate-binding protein